MSAARALKGITPSKTLRGNKPNISKKKVCGCLGFIHVPKEKRHTKLSSKAEPVLLLGFARTTTGYRLLHLETGAIIEARDMESREHITVSKKYISALLKGKNGSTNHSFCTSAN